MSTEDERSTRPPRPRLILLTQWFDPEPTFKGIVFARALQERGFDVEVVTGFPNYPGGKVYSGYRIRPIQIEQIDSIPVTRLALYPSHDGSAFRRIANYCSFFLSCLIYLTFMARRADIVYVYHPPLTVGLAAAIAKIFRRTPTVIDIQDMWPDTLRATGMVDNKTVLNLVAWLCKRLYRSMNHIVVLSPGFRDLLVQRGVPREKVTVIYNWADEASIAFTNIKVPDAFGDREKFRILFAGNMGFAQALDNVLDAAKIAVVENPDIEFCLLGGGHDVRRLKARAAEEKITNVRFLPQVPMTDVGHYLGTADCLLVHLRADPLFSITIPSKTQAYMAAGKPIIMAVEGNAASLIENSKGGLVVPPEDPSALARAAIGLAALPSAELESFGQAARDYYRDILSLNIGVDAFSGVFSALLKKESHK